MRSDWVSWEAREKKPSGSVLDGYKFFTYTSPDNHLRVLFTANSDCPDVRHVFRINTVTDGADSLQALGCLW